MKKMLLFLCLSLCATTIPAQINYQSTDPNNPIAFDGKTLIYKGDTIVLGPKTFFIDGSLPDNIAQTYAFVFSLRRQTQPYAGDDIIDKSHGNGAVLNQFIASYAV